MNTPVLTKTVTLEHQELDYLRHWHAEQASFQTQRGREQQAEWHRDRLKALDSSSEPEAVTKIVTRYEVLDRDGSGDNVEGHPRLDGEWVRYDDIKHLLQVEPTASTACVVPDSYREAVQARSVTVSWPSESKEPLPHGTPDVTMSTAGGVLYGHVNEVWRADREPPAPRALAGYEKFVRSLPEKYPNVTIVPGSYTLLGWDKVQPEEEFPSSRWIALKLALRRVVTRLSPNRRGDPSA